MVALKNRQRIEKWLADKEIRLPVNGDVFEDKATAILICEALQLDDCSVDVSFRANLNVNVIVEWEGGWCCQEMNFFYMGRLRRLAPIPR